MADIANFAVELVNAPGNSSPINLAGPVAGRVALSATITSGETIYYTLDDGSQQEMGVGTYRTGNPNTLSRDAVVWTSISGYTNPYKLAFNGATRVYTGVSAHKLIYADENGNVVLPEPATAANHALRADNFISAVGPQGSWSFNSYTGRGEQWGQAATGSNGGVNVVFPRNDFGVPQVVLCTLVLAGPGAAFIGTGSNVTANGFTAVGADQNGNALSGLVFNWISKH